MPTVRKRRTLGFLAGAAVLIALAGPARPVAAEEAVELFTDANQPIPQQSRTGVPYNSWSLFLVCNPAWLLPQSERQLTDLYQVFRAFGGAIGVEHLAVWFRAGSLSGATKGHVDKTDVDVLRSAAFCASLGLAPSAGPYVVITTEYPGAGLLNQYPQSFPKELGSFSVIGLAGKNSDAITRILAGLADKLALNKMQHLDPQKEEWWRGLESGYEAFRASFVGAGQGMAFKIKTPFFEIEKKL